MAATTQCQQHYTSNDSHDLTERSLPSEMTSSPPVAAYSTAGNEPENDGVTKKSDSGVYFAMMLSEYLDKKAMEETTIKANNSSDESDTITTTTTTTTTTVEPTTVNSANDNVGRHIPHGHPKDETYAEAQVKEVMANLPNLIWVPAHKHPQIAPSEFVNWIQVHGETPAMKQSKVRRQKSKLSRSMSYNDANITSNEDSNTSTSTTSSSSSGEDSPTSPKDYDLPQMQMKDVGFSFDRHPTEIDSSPILAPPTTHHRTLLRRSAVSARRTASESNADRRRSRRTQQQSRHAVDTSDRMGHVPTEAVNLHDHPVSMSEWIDLGNASLESSESQHGILSRVHDAESQLLKFMDDDDDDDKKVDKATTTTTTIPEEPEESYPNTTVTNDDDDDDDIASTEPSTLDNKRMTLRRSASDLVPQKSEKKMSWIGALLNGDKKKRRSLRRINNEKHKDQASLQLTRVNSMGAVSTTTGNKKRGLAAFISRSLSKSSSSTGRKESKKTKKEPIPPPSSTATSSVTTVTTRQFIHSYRLPIHVERAIYRLSHMKLANPRRPLHQQVVISNFMFWYLSIINPQATTTTSPNNNNTQWSQEGEEATLFRTPSSSSPPPPSSSSNHRFQKPSLNKKYERRTLSTTGSSDEEDNVPLSFYRK